MDRAALSPDRRARPWFKIPITETDRPGRSPAQLLWDTGPYRPTSRGGDASAVAEGDVRAALVLRRFLTERAIYGTVGTAHRGRDPGAGPAARVSYPFWGANELRRSRLACGNTGQAVVEVVPPKANRCGSRDRAST